MPVIDAQAPWRSPRRQAERYDHAAAEAALKRCEALATLMDAAVTLPGSNVRVGLDAVLGLVPVVGDVLSQVISSYIIWEARRLGVSKLTIWRMIANSTFDTLVGSVPLVGDAFDVAFRSNLKNVRLLKSELERMGVGRKTIDL